MLKELNILVFQQRTVNSGHKTEFLFKASSGKSYFYWCELLVLPNLFVSLSNHRN